MQDEHGKEFDFSQIAEYIFLGANLCCDEKAHINFLEKLDITADIDLEEERQDAPPKVDVYLWLPVKDHTPPNQAQFDAGVALLTELIKNQKKVYVHCKYGHGRSPTLVAAYLMSTGLGLDKAIKTISSSRPEIHLEPAQLAALKKYEKSLQ